MNTKLPFSVILLIILILLQPITAERLTMDQSSTNLYTVEYGLLDDVDRSVYQSFSFGNNEGLYSIVITYSSPLGLPIYLSGNRLAAEEVANMTDQIQVWYLHESNLNNYNTGDRENVSNSDVIHAYDINGEFEEYYKGEYFELFLFDREGTLINSWNPEVETTSAKQLIELMQERDADKDAPSTVTGLELIYKSRNNITFQWNRASDNDFVAFYKIYRNSHYLVTVYQLTFSDTNVETGLIYSYTVSAVDRSGNEGDRSLPLEVLVEAPSFDESSNNLEEEGYSGISPIIVLAVTGVLLFFIFSIKRLKKSSSISSQVRTASRSDLAKNEMKRRRHQGYKKIRDTENNTQ